MKSMKKIAALALSACLAAPMIGNIAYAAEGTLQDFTAKNTEDSSFWKTKRRAALL